MASATRKPGRLASTSSVMHTNAVYWPNHSVYQGNTPGQLNYGCINHVYYAFANVSATGEVYLSDEWADCTAPCDDASQGALGSLMRLKQKHRHLQVVLSVGGSEASDIFPLVASNATMRDTFARSAQGLVEASGLDGIDIMWEYPETAGQGNDFLTLLATIRLYLPEDHYILTAALPAGIGLLQMVDVRHAAEYLDFINLVAYDFFGAWSQRSGHHAQLFSTDENEPSAASAVHYLTASSVPANKILLGIPVFGRGFSHAKGPGQRFHGVGGEDGFFPYSDLPRRRTKEVVDKRAVAAQCVGEDDGFVTYDNPDTVKMKALFCKQHGLGGLFYWNAPADAKDSKRSLVAAGFRALHSA